MKPLGEGSLNAAHPAARGAYMLRKFVGVGFRSSPGEGARAVMTSYYEKTATKRHKEKEFSFINSFVYLRVTSWLKK
jgi:hypothetical protein